MNRIIIRSVPDGEAPLEVRQAWVGLELPIVGGEPGPSDHLTVGVVSGTVGFWNWLFSLLRFVLGNRPKTTGFVVRGQEALAVLEEANPEAASWWREKAPSWVGPKGCLIFQESACEIVDDSDAGH